MNESEATSTRPRQPFPSWKQALVTFGGGVVLAATACVGFFASFGGNFERGGNAFSAITGILFFVGLLAVIGGALLVFICTVRAIMNRRIAGPDADRRGDRP